MSKFTKSILTAGIMLMLYGYICRIVHLYFFWESKYAGWALIFIGAVGFLVYRVHAKKIQGRKTIVEKIGIGIISFILLIQLILLIVIPRTGAYKTSLVFLLNNTGLKNEVGNIKSFSLIPLGSVEKKTVNHIETGNATIFLTVKGDKRFKDVTVYLEKGPGMDWAVIAVQ
jgi:hypothetical protein